MVLHPGSDRVFCLDKKGFSKFGCLLDYLLQEQQTLWVSKKSEYTAIDDIYGGLSNRNRVSGYIIMGMMQGPQLQVVTY